MKNHKHVLLLVAALIIAIGENAAIACTGGMVLGLSSAEGNMLGTTKDLLAPATLDDCRVFFVETTGKNRVLKTGHDAPWGTYINEKGVGLRSYFRAGRGKEPPQILKKIDRTKIVCTLMGNSDTAKMAAEELSEFLTKYGTGSLSYGKALLIMDPQEGYLLEALDYVYGKPENHAIDGPIKNTLFVNTNFYFDERLRAHQAGIGAGYNRAKRMWELLVKQQYASIDLQPSAKSGITLAYMMKTLRDRGLLTTYEENLSPYTTTGEPAISQRGETVMTQNAEILIAPEEHADLLSVMWVALGQPNSTPFLPFYIGMSKVPDKCISTDAATAFHKLRLALDFHPEYYTKVQDFWTVFELQTIDEAKGKEQKIKKLLRESKDDPEDAEKKARKLLTDFVQLRVDKALHLATEMMLMLEKLPLLSKQRQ